MFGKRCFDLPIPLCKRATTVCFLSLFRMEFCLMVHHNSFICSISSLSWNVKLLIHTMFLFVKSNANSLRCHTTKRRYLFLVFVWILSFRIKVVDFGTCTIFTVTNEGFSLFNPYFVCCESCEIPFVAVPRKFWTFRHRPGVLFENGWKEKTEKSDFLWYEDRWRGNP